MKNTEKYQKLEEENRRLRAELDKYKQDSTSSVEKSEKRYKQLSTLSIEGVLIHDMGTIIDANKAICDMSGYSYNELIGMNVLQLLPEKYHQKIIVSMTKGYFEIFEAEGLRKNEQLIDIEVESRFTNLPSGNTIRSVVVRDIALRKKKEQELIDSEQRYRAIVESSFDGIFIYQNDRYVYANKSLSKLSGYTMEEITKNSISELVAPEDINRVQGFAMRRAQGYDVPSTYKVKVRYKDNSYHQLLLHVRVIQYNGEYAALGSVKDMTKDMKNQIALQESEERYKAIVEKSNDGIYIYQDNGVVYANKRFSQINGYSKEELKTVSVNDIIHPDDKERIIGYTENRMEGEDSPSEYKMKIIHKSGDIRQLEASVKAITYRGKYAVLGTIADVTEKERIAKALKESEERYKAIVENSYDGIYIFQNDKFIFANDKIAKLLGYTKKELYKFGIADIVVPKDLPRIAEHTRKRAMGEEAPEDFKTTIKCKDGTILEFLISVNIIQYNGSYAVLGAIKDQTAEIEYQQALAESEERYKAIVENSYDGIYIYQNDKFTYVNDRLCELSGYSQEEAMNKTIWEFIHGDDIKRIEGYAKLRMIGKEAPNTYKAKIICKNKEVKNTEFHVSITKYKGKFAVIGTVRDITEKELADKALHESEERFKLFSSLSLEGMIIHDNGLLLDVNNATNDMFGYSTNEAVGKYFTTFIHKDSHEKVLNAAKNKIVTPYEGVGLRRNGTQFPMEIEARIITLPNNKIVRAVALRDITERKKAERALIESEAYNKVLFHDSHIPLVVMEAENFTYIDCNQAVVDIYGFKSREEVLGKTPNDVSAPTQYNGGKSSDAAQKSISQALETGSSIFEWRHQNPDGKIWDAEVHLMRLDYNEKQYLQFSLLDITDRKIAAKTLLESEERFKQLSSLSLEGLLIHKDGMIQDVNIALSKIFGYTVEEFLNIHFGKFIDKESHPVIIEAMRKQSTEPYEVVGVRKDGVKFPIELESRNITLFNGKKVRATAVRDITERKQTEQILRESEERYKTLSDITFEGIAILKQGIIIDVNLALAKMVGYSQEELVGQNIIELLSVPKYIDLITSKIKSNYSAPYEIEFIRKDKSTFYVEVEARDYITSEGEKARVVAYRDLTKHKKTETKVYQQNIELKKVNAEKDKFFSIIAHDLRSPFTSIIGLSELLKSNVDYFDKVAIKQYADIINSSAVNTFKLLDNLLQWANFAGGAMQFKKEQVNLKEIFDIEIESLGQVAHTKEIELIADIPDDIFVNIDINMQRTIIRNLVSNAIKYTERKGKIIIDTIVNNDNIEISVSDNGVGMPAETQVDLFKIDKTISTSGTENENGTGLGLILCKEFIEKHNGTISCESKLGKGSVFTYTIPV